MARVTLRCADCGKQMASNARSLPQGDARCHQCRRLAIRPAKDYSYKKTLTCADCAQPMWQSPTSKPQGQARCRPCRRASPQRLKPVRKAQPRKIRQCKGCGVDLPADAGHARLYCTDRCRRARTCEVCGKDYYPQSKTQRTCSRACGWVIKRKPEPKPLSQLKIVMTRYGNCAVCREPVTRRGRGTMKMYCPQHQGYQPKTGQRTLHCLNHPEPVPFTHIVKGSGSLPALCPDCRRQARIEASRAAKARRRARKKAAVVERVGARYIFERDGWRCGICRKPVAKDKVVPHPKAPTLDHIVPLAQGGNHTKTNLQCAHFLCNSLKGANGSAWQEALIG